MGLISPTYISDGTQVDAVDVNSMVQTIASEFNGGIDASNIEDNAITTAKIADSAISTAKVAADAITNATAVIDTVGQSQLITGTTLTDITNASSGSLTTSGGDLFLIATFGGYKSTAVGGIRCRVVIGSTNVPNATGWRYYFNGLSEHQAWSFSTVVTGIAAGTYTVKMQMGTDANGLSIDVNDQFTLTIVELKR